MEESDSRKSEKRNRGKGTIPPALEGKAEGAIRNSSDKASGNVQASPGGSNVATPSRTVLKTQGYGRKGRIPKGDPLSHLAKLCSRLKREIRERKKAQSELKKNELYFRNLIETMNGGLAIQDEKGIITYVNDNLCEISGYCREDFVGRSTYHFLQLIDAADRHILLDQVNRRKEGETAAYEIRGARKDGTRMHVIVSPKPLLDERGTYKGSFAVVTDITELKLAEERLRSYGEQLQCLSSKLMTTQERERKRLSMELHDDLGQTLLALKFCAKSLKTRLPPHDGDELTHECTQLMNLSDEIVCKIRQVSRDMSPLILEDLGLSTSLAMLVDDFSKRYKIQCIADVEEMNTVLDPEAQILIYRIAQECLTNIAKHSRASRVLLLFRRKGKKAVFQIEDNGIGFPANQEVHDPSSGKGLGLIAMAERVRMLGSKLEIKSQEGSTRIRFCFPLTYRGVE